MLTNPKQFAAKGEDWDAPWPASGETAFAVEAVRDVLWRRNYARAQGYDGPVKKPRYDGRAAHPDEPRPRSLAEKPVMLEHRNEPFVAPEYEPGVGHKLISRTVPPKQELPVDTDWEAECAKKERQWKEALARERAEMEARRAAARRK